MPLAIEHEVLVLVADLVPHEQIWLVFLSNFIAGHRFGMALGLTEVTLAERLVRGAHGPGEDVRSDDVELPDSDGLTTEAGSSERATTAVRPSRSSGGSRWKRRSTERTMPVLELSLQAGESIVSEAGEFSWMSDSIQMETNTGGGMGGKGIMGAVKRAVAGALRHDDDLHRPGRPRLGRLRVEGARATSCRSTWRRGTSSWCTGTGSWRRRQGIELTMGFQQSFRGGIFGGEGFILQKIGGTGRAFIDLSGEVIVYDLAAGPDDAGPPRPRRPLPGLGDVLGRRRCPGLANRYMGADGHHFAVLTGPGRIWLQSMPIPMLAGVIGDYLPDEAIRSRRVRRPRARPRCWATCSE